MVSSASPPIMVSQKSFLVRDIGELGLEYEEVVVGGGREGSGGSGDVGGEGGGEAREGRLAWGSPSHTGPSLVRLNILLLPRRPSSPPPDTLLESVSLTAVCCCCWWWCCLRASSEEGVTMTWSAVGLAGLNITVPVLESPASSDEELGGEASPTGDQDPGDARPPSPTATPDTIGTGGSAGSGSASTTTT